MSSIETVSKNRIKEIVKLHQKKYRDEQGLFIAEGYKVLEELLEIRESIIEIFALKSADISKIGHPVSVVDEETMKKISTTDTTCEILTIAKKQERDITKFSNLKKLVLLDSISDPGNLGTIIRSATAFGIEGIILFGNCVDLYSPKVIRSTTGNFFKTPIINIKNKDEIKNLFKSHLKIATALSKENNISLKECAKIDKYIIMLGSEAKGLQEDLTNIADKNIRLEMINNVESLNLSVSASIIFYELFIN
ncbi:MAG: RNA methyltransferase [Candidatus Gastranaerophilales bacterium]|nr:RNA methyltransferase [Candidatus Gastranaerophilales bacterium]